MAKTPKSKNKSKSSHSDAYTDANYQILPNIEAIKAFDSKMTGVSYSYLDVLAHEHAVAFTVAKMMDEDLLSETKQAISNALKNGTDFREFQKQLKPYMMKQGWWGEDVMTDPIDGQRKKVQLGSTRRLRTIYHTNLHSAYAAGQWERIEQTKDAFPFLEYMPSLAQRKRKDHKQYYGWIKEVSDPIWQYIMPPNGYGCLCWVKQLTRKQAEAKGITDDKDIEFEQYENPRTGQKIDVPVGITPSFAHNAGDRLGALMKIAEDKHGSAFAEQLESQLDDFVMRMLKPDTVDVVSFANFVARQVEVDRLVSEGVREHEAELADQWQQYYDVQMVGYQDGVHKLKTTQPPDLAIRDAGLPVIEWQTLDIMYKIAKDADRDAFNRSFTKKIKSWEHAQNNIRRHLSKADIVPMYLDSFDTRTRTRILSFVLSLTKDEQKQVVLITDKPL